MDHIVYCSTIYNSKDMEITSVLTGNDWMKRMWCIEYDPPLWKDEI